MRTPVFMFALITAAALGCGSDSTEPQPHIVASIDVSVKGELEIGDTDEAIAIAPVAQSDGLFCAIEAVSL